MMYSVRDKRILEGPGARFLETTGKDSGPFAPNLPDMIVIHYTAGRDLGSCVRFLCDPSEQVSTHLVVGRSGEILQLIPFDRIAWHAGQSEFQGRSGINKYSIGIELDNAGRLERSEDGYKAWFGACYPEEEVFAGIHRNENTLSHWHAYTGPQLEAVFAVCRALVPALGIRHIVGHEEISPGRKPDPGPAFPLEKLRRSAMAL